jgi:hypothetical protein
MASVNGMIFEDGKREQGAGPGEAGVLPGSLDGTGEEVQEEELHFEA